MGYRNFYDKYNRCRRCQITYPKTSIKCLNCGARLATRRRVYASDAHEIKEARREHTRV